MFVVASAESRDRKLLKKGGGVDALVTKKKNVRCSYASTLLEIFKYIIFKYTHTQHTHTHTHTHT